MKLIDRWKGLDFVTVWWALRYLGFVEIPTQKQSVVAFRNVHDSPAPPSEFPDVRPLITLPLQSPLDTKAIVFAVIRQAEAFGYFTEEEFVRQVDRVVEKARQIGGTPDAMARDEIQPYDTPFASELPPLSTGCDDIASVSTRQDLPPVAREIAPTEPSVSDEKENVED